MITREKNEGNVLTLKLKVSAKGFADAVQEAYKKTAHKFNIQGFRKGKAPKAVIEKEYGDTVFFDEALNIIITKEYTEFLDKNLDIVPIAAPSVSIDAFTIDKGVEATMTVEVEPEVKLGDISSMKFTKKKAEVTEEMVEHELKHLVEHQARFVETEEAATMGDFVTFDFKGFVNDVAFEGGEAKDYRLELGSKSFIPGFEEALVGFKKGDENKIDVVFPEDYASEELKGKPAVFEIKMKKVEKKELPELNDKLIADSTEFETLAEYKKDLKAKMLETQKVKVEQEFETEVINAVVEASTVEIPEKMIDREFDNHVRQMNQRLSYQKISYEDYLKYTGSTLEQEKEKMKDYLTKNVKSRLVLQALSKEFKPKATEKEIDAKILQYSGTQKENLEEFKKSLSAYEKAYIENEVLLTKLIKKVTEGNIIEE